MSEGLCEGCGAPTGLTEIVCSYCGHSIEGRLAEVSPGVSLNDAIAAIDNNIEALEAMPQHTIPSTLYSVVYWYFAVGTYGIATKFLGKPKTTDKKSFGALVKKIRRNIENTEDMGGSDAGLLRKLERAKTAVSQAEGDAEDARKLRLKTLLAIPALFVLMFAFTAMSTCGMSSKVASNKAEQDAATELVMEFEGMYGKDGATVTIVGENLTYAWEGNTETMRITDVKKVGDKYRVDTWRCDGTVTKTDTGVKLLMSGTYDYCASMSGDWAAK